MSAGHRPKFMRRRLTGWMCAAVLLALCGSGCATNMLRERGSSALTETLDGEQLSGQVRPISHRRQPPLQPPQNATSHEHARGPIDGNAATEQQPPRRDAQIQPLRAEVPLEARHPAARALAAGEAMGQGQALVDSSLAEPMRIDLPTALRLAGANNLQIALASERVERAYAQVAIADAMWLPSLRGSLSYNNHSGRLQAASGDVLESARSSLFVGGGVGTGSAPLAAGANGPARMVVDMSLTDVLFEPLAQQQLVHRADARLATTFNDTLATVALAYQELVRGRTETQVADIAIADAKALVNLTEQFAAAGSGLQADVERARAEVSLRQRQRMEAVERERVASTRLVRLLQLHAGVQLQPVDQTLTPLDLVKIETPLPDLLAQAMQFRPELREAEALVAQSEIRMSQENYRPLLPHVYAGWSFGGFGGSGSSDLSSFSDRSDLDLAAVWELQNMGWGAGIRRREQASLNRQALLAGEDLRAQIAGEVAAAHARVIARREQFALANQRAVQSHQSLVLSMKGIQGLQLRPIEAHQAIAAVAAARNELLQLIQDYNTAQLELLRAIGKPPRE